MIKGVGWEGKRGRKEKGEKRERRGGGGVMMIVWKVQAICLESGG